MSNSFPALPGAGNAPCVSCPSRVCTAWCICCPIMGTKGNWWCNLSRRHDDELFRRESRVSKSCICMALKWGVAKKPAVNAAAAAAKKKRDAAAKRAAKTSALKTPAANDMDRGASRSTAGTATKNRFLAAAVRATQQACLARHHDACAREGYPLPSSQV